MSSGGQLALFAGLDDPRLRVGLVATSLQSGSSGNATLVSAGRTSILIDCGISPRRLEERLAPLGRTPRELAAVFVTHEHWDHAGGCGVLSRRFRIPLYMTEGTARAAAGRIFKKKAERELVRILPRSGRLALAGGRALENEDAPGELAVEWLTVPHDAAEPVAFAVECRSVRVGVLTDLGHASRAVRAWFETLDAVLLETNHDRDMLATGSYPASLKRRIASRLGHLSNEQAAALVRDHASPRLRVLLLGHLSADNNRPERALDALHAALGRRSDLEVRLELTRRDAAAAPVKL